MVKYAQTTSNLVNIDAKAKLRYLTKTDASNFKIALMRILYRTIQVFGTNPNPH